MYQYGIKDIAEFYQMFSETNMNIRNQRYNRILSNVLRNLVCLLAVFISKT